MPNVASILKAEITRIARKEVRSEVEGLKKAMFVGVLRLVHDDQWVALRDEAADVSTAFEQLRRVEREEVEGNQPILPKQALAFLQPSSPFRILFFAILRLDRPILGLLILRQQDAQRLRRTEQVGMCREHRPEERVEGLHAQHAALSLRHFEPCGLADASDGCPGEAQEEDRLAGRQPVADAYDCLLQRNRCLAASWAADDEGVPLAIKELPAKVADLH